MYLDTNSLPLLKEALEKLQRGFAHLPPITEGRHSEKLGQILSLVAERMQDNYPYFHPLYAGQMLKPPHPVARLAYMLSLWINPNNHALDGGRASSEMEKEAVQELAAMFGWPSALGHLTSGGTMANLEGLWISGRLTPGKTIVASDQAHYTHQRISDVLQLPFTPVRSDRHGRMDPGALRELLESGNVGTVVVTIGTTSTGSVDPLPEILDLQRTYHFRIHADAAYGGYFRLATNLRAETRASYELLSQVDSIAIDPHKHGLQPYGCGCILHRDPAVGTLYKHDSPYTYFTSSDLHLGEISLECSRAGASAVALWATQRLLPLVQGGEFALDLERCRESALRLAQRLRGDNRFIVLVEPELDIVVWALKAGSVSGISERSRALFAEAAKRNLHLALARFDTSMLDPQSPGFLNDEKTVVCLRSCLLKSEHVDWIDRIGDLISDCADTVLRG